MKFQYYEMPITSRAIDGLAVCVKFHQAQVGQADIKQLRFSMQDFVEHQNPTEMVVAGIRREHGLNKDQLISLEEVKKFYVGEPEPAAKPDLLKVTVDDKYTVVQHADGSCEALRYGEKWRDLSGDNLVLSLAQTIDSLCFLLTEAKAEIKKLKGEK